nr:hypothetical protein Iba_chr04aCG22490 [Ipomoea batatas]GMC87237.1 hypothetical protein Iba_chr04dCG18230 [Ipomoea batatas]
MRKEIYNANDAVYVFFSTQTTPFRYFFTPKIPIFQIGSLLHGLWYITSLRRSTDCLQVFNHHQESSPPPPPFGLFRNFRHTLRLRVHWKSPFREGETCSFCPYHGN